MAKINVVLTAVLDNGKEQLVPGETVSMEEARAQKLAALGMVTLPKKAALTKAAKNKTTDAAKVNSKQATKGQDTGDPDSGADDDDEGNDNTEGNDNDEGSNDGGDQ
jgi:hypothetical protein